MATVEVIELTVAENTRDGAEPVGSAVSATDADSNSLTYTLEGPGQGLKFSIVSSSGQIRTRSPLNHEAEECHYEDEDGKSFCRYSVTVKVDDRQKKEQQQSRRNR